MIRPLIARVRLVTMASEVDTRTMASEFPTLKIERAHAARVDDAIIDADEWRKAKSFALFDETLARSRGDALMVRGDRHVELVACEALTRYQRFVERRNGSSRTRVFEQILMAHRALCAPFVTNELDRALDTWQWMLRLDPAASLTAQLAALFYTGDDRQSPPPPEQLAAPADVLGGSPARTPLHSETYLRAGAPILDELGNPISPVELQVEMHPTPPTPRETRPAWTLDALDAVGIEESIAARIREIVLLREHRGRDTEMDLLTDAAALSFLSLGSSGYLDSFGPEPTRQKLVSTLGRMGDVARTKLSHVRLRPDVRTLFQRAVAA